MSASLQPARGRPLVFVAVVTALLLVSSLLRPRQAAAQCESAAARALSADARRATLWNWGWGGLFGVSALAHGGLALLSDDDNQRVALWTGATKSTLGTFNQILFPVRIYEPKGECDSLRAQLVSAADKERKKRNWLAHATILGVGIASFSFVQYMTDDLSLSLTGAIVGTFVGELSIYTSPNRVRSQGFASDTLSVVPMLGKDRTGFVLGARF